ncbi:hypothetical protein POM88_015548 [Heracleum sosnowskyi]|uniref:Myb/SANT-like domain-containing protein n=1 Tax=Heracleum sosnowskyi TaxID=360622 RepID=A0AAD8INY4_9APIA|nr:hypothetical protein POM88_015548 [Heracleum sosnowskyi]
MSSLDELVMLQQLVRMNRNTYDILCELLREYGLSDSRDVNVEEQKSLMASSSLSGKQLREGRNRRTWTLVEEKALIDSYYLIIADGYKLDNGKYKTGYLLELEKYMIKFIPGTDLREKPHIDSKIKIWKKIWGSIYSALATSGIAWNDSHKILSINDEDVWTQMCKRDSELAKLCNKPVEWYDDWQKFFGEAAEFSCSTGDSHANEGKRKKAKLQDDLLASMEKMQENVESLLKTTVEQFGVMSQRIGYEHDLGKSRREVYGIINSINNLSSKQKLLTTSKIVDKSTDVDLFLSLPEETQAEFVNLKLTGHV